MSEELNILVAETAPIIRSGVVASLRRLPDYKITPYEVHSMAELTRNLSDKFSGDRVRNLIIIANPNFGGLFDPLKIRELVGEEVKIIALEVGRLDRYAQAQYDAVISIVDELETISEKIHSLIVDEDASPDGDKDKDLLSQREKEIVALVVKGMTNKEIADTLFLSVHTVITHRRNIARKLEIHSATGLTIYAIVNKLVDLSEIKL